jgi:hypothetical protein
MPAEPSRRGKDRESIQRPIIAEVKRGELVRFYEKQQVGSG